MNIILIWPFFYPDRSGVACSNRGEAFSKYLSKKENVNVHVFAPEKSSIHSTVEYEGVIVERIKTYNYYRGQKNIFTSFVLSIFSLFSFLKRVKKLNPDVIIASTPGPFLPLESFIVAKFLRIPFVFDMQDSWHLSSLSHKGRFKNNFKMALEKLCAVNAELIFTVTPTLRSIISEGYGIDENRIKVIYNGVNPASHNFQEVDKNMDLIHLGSPRIYYDTLRLVDALEIIIKKYPGVNIEFLGCTDEDYVRSVIDKVTEKGLSQNIQFSPPIEHEQVYRRLLESKIGIISLIDQDVYRSAIGVKVFEYMQAGIPTVFLGPLESEQEQIITSNSIGLSASNIDGFANNVLSLLEINSLRTEMGENAKNAIQSYMWEHLIDDAWSCLKQTLNIVR